MVNPTSLGTRDIPLKFAKIVSQKAKKEYDDGTFLNKVTPITRELLRFWFEDSFCETRKFNFHEGQKQAILNAIYIHEILKTKNVIDMYMSANPELLQEMDLLDLKQDKYSHPKYAVKMATGTGKTWVLNAQLIWQFLNAKNEMQPSGLFSKNWSCLKIG